MLNEMTNGLLITHVLGNESASEIEMELADRLHRAIEEIEDLVKTVTQLRAAADGKDT